MEPKRIAVLVLAGVLVVSAAAVALPDQAADRADEHAQDDRRPDDAGQAAGNASDEAAEPPEEAYFGICTAYENSEKGREMGQAEEHGVFAWLIEMTSGLVEPFCDDVEHPADAHGPPAQADRGLRRAPVDV